VLHPDSLAKMFWDMDGQYGHILKQPAICCLQIVAVNLETDLTVRSNFSGTGVVCASVATLEQVLDLGWVFFVKTAFT